MTYKYMLLKDSFGIVIIIEMEEFINSEVLPTDIHITQNIYLRIADGIGLNTDIIVKRIGLGIKDMAKQISEKVKEISVCFYLKNIDFDDAHFQQEALYCAIQEWIAKYYGLQPPNIQVDFDRITHAYTFHIPSNR